MTAIRPRRMNHLNLVLEDFEAGVAHLAGLFDADFLMDIPNRETHACLIDIGRVIFEVFVPNAWLLNARYGPHYVGIEYAANMDTVRSAVAERGIRVVRDVGLALHTHPADTLGVAFEFFDGEFHDNQERLGRPMRPASYWREHAMGLAGLKCWTLLVRDIDGARAFLESFIGARPIYEELRPDVVARAVGMQVADDVVELLSPTGPGWIEAMLHRHGEGIHSAVFAVRDREAAIRYFLERKVTLSSVSRSDRIALAPAGNLGIWFEFAEEEPARG